MGGGSSKGDGGAGLHPSQTMRVLMVSHDHALVDPCPELEPNELLVSVHRAHDLRAVDKSVFSKTGSSDPFVEVSLNGVVVTSSTKKRTTTPEWHELLSLPAVVAVAETSIIVATVYDYDQLSSPDFMGVCAIKLSTLLDREEHREWHDLCELSGAPPVKTRGELELRLRWVHNPEREVALPEAFEREGHVSHEKRPNALRLCVVRALNLPIMDKNVVGKGGSTDPYVEINLGTMSMRTTIKKKCLNPLWLESFEFDGEDLEEEAAGQEAFTGSVFDYDLAGADDLVGGFSLSGLLGDPETRETRRVWLPVVLPEQVVTSRRRRRSKTGLSPSASPRAEKPSASPRILPPRVVTEMEKLIAAPSAGAQVEVALRRVHNPDFVVHLPKGALEPTGKKSTSRAANELRVVVIRAKNLPAMDTAPTLASMGIKGFGLSSGFGRSAASIPRGPSSSSSLVSSSSSSRRTIRGDTGGITTASSKDKGGASSDPFVVLELAGVQQKTRVVKRDLNPTWLDVFAFGIEEIKGLKLECKIFDHDTLSAADFMAKCNIDLTDLQDGHPCRKWNNLSLDASSDDFVRGEKHGPRMEVALRWVYNAERDVKLPKGVMEDKHPEKQANQFNVGLLRARGLPCHEDGTVFCTVAACGERHVSRGEASTTEPTWLEVKEFAFEGSKNVSVIIEVMRHHDNSDVFLGRLEIRLDDYKDRKLKRAWFDLYDNTKRKRKVPNAHLELELRCLHNSQLDNALPNLLTVPVSEGACNELRVCVLRGRNFPSKPLQTPIEAVVRVLLGSEQRSTKLVHSKIEANPTFAEVLQSLELNDQEVGWSSLEVQLLDNRHNAMSVHGSCRLDLLDLAQRSIDAPETVWCRMDPGGGKVELALRWVHNPKRAMLPKLSNKLLNVDPALPPNRLLVIVLRAARLPIADASCSEAQCTLRLGAESRTSSKVPKQTSPSWATEAFEFDITDDSATLEICVADAAIANDELLGRVVIHYAGGEQRQAWYELANAPQGKERGSVEVFTWLAHSIPTANRLRKTRILERERLEVLQAADIAEAPLRLAQEFDGTTADYAIARARNIRNRPPNELHVVLARGRHLKSARRKNDSGTRPIPDSYVNLSILAMQHSAVAGGHAEQCVIDSQQSSTIKGTRVPAWQERFALKLPRPQALDPAHAVLDPATSLLLVAYDKAAQSKDKQHMGSITLELSKLSAEIKQGYESSREWRRLSREAGELECWMRLFYNERLYPEEVLLDEVDLIQEAANELRVVVLGAKAVIRWTQLAPLDASLEDILAAKKKGGLQIELELSGCKRATEVAKWTTTETAGCAFKDTFALQSKAPRSGARDVLKIRLYEWRDDTRTEIGTGELKLEAYEEKRGEAATVTITRLGAAKTDAVSEAFDTVAHVDLVLRLAHDAQLADMLLPEPEVCEGGTATGLDAPPLPLRADELEEVERTPRLFPEEEEAVQEEEKEETPRWFYVTASGAVGPRTVMQLRRLWENEEINNETLVWREGLADWRPVDVMHALKRVLWAYPDLPLPSAEEHRRNDDQYFIAKKEVSFTSSDEQQPLLLLEGEVEEGTLDLAVELDARQPDSSLGAGMERVDDVEGPYTEDELRDAVEAGTLEGEDLVWQSSSSEDEWRKVEELGSRWSRRQQCGCEALKEPELAMQCELCGGVATVHSLAALEVQLRDGDVMGDRQPRRASSVEGARAGSTLFATEILDGLLWLASSAEAFSDRKRLKALHITHVAWVGGLDPPVSSIEGEDDDDDDTFATVATIDDTKLYLDPTTHDDFCAEGDQRYSTYDDEGVMAGNAPSRKQTSVTGLVERSAADPTLSCLSVSTKNEKKKGDFFQPSCEHIPLVASSSTLDLSDQLRQASDSVYDFVENAKFRVGGSNERRHVRILLVDNATAPVDAEDYEVVHEAARPLWRGALTAALLLGRSDGLRADEALTFVLSRLLESNNLKEALSPQELVPERWYAPLVAVAEEHALGRLFCAECFEKWRLGVVDDVLSTKVGAALRRLRARDPSLVRLELAGEGALDCDAAGVLGAAVGYASSLTHLDVSSCSLGDAGSAALATALIYGVKGVGGADLTHLCLSYNKIGDLGLRAVAALVQASHTSASRDATCHAGASAPLTALDLSHNAITYRGARQLARALRSNSTLIFLDLESNKIGDLGGTAIFSVLTKPDSATLKSERASIHLKRGLEVARREKEGAAPGDNDNADDAIKDRLAAAAAYNNSLTSINLGSNQLGARAATQMAATVRVNHLLSRIDISRNPTFFIVAPSPDSSFVGRYMVTEEEEEEEETTESSEAAFNARVTAARTAESAQLTRDTMDANTLHPRECLTNLRLYNGSLCWLTLSYTALDATTLRELGRWFSQAQLGSACTRLDLAACSIDARGCKAFAEGISQGEPKFSLQQLDLSRNNITSKGAAQLCAALTLVAHGSTPLSLRSLGLAQCALDDRGVTCIAAALLDGRLGVVYAAAAAAMGGDQKQEKAKPAALASSQSSRLLLTGRDTQATALSRLEALVERKNRSSKLLSNSSNCFMRAGARNAFTPSLPTMGLLPKASSSALSLPRSSPSSTVVTSTSMMTTTMMSHDGGKRRPAFDLEELDLSDNAVGPRGAEALSKAMSAALLDEAPIRLLRLRLANVGLAQRGAEVLGAVLARGGAPRLEILDVSTNAIHDSGCEALTKAIKKLPRLRKVDIAYNDLSEACSDSLSRAVLTTSHSTDVEKMLPLDVRLNGNFDELQADNLVFAIAPNLARSKMSFAYSATTSPRQFPADPAKLYRGPGFVPGPAAAPPPEKQQNDGFASMANALAGF